MLGAAGGVGATAVELGKIMGATVIAAASIDGKNSIWPVKLGANHTINYTTQDLRERLKEITGGKGVDVVYDPVGGPIHRAGIAQPCLEGPVPGRRLRGW